MADLSSIKRFISENGGVLAASAILEEESYISEELEHAGTTTNLEPTEVVAIDEGRESELSYFEDGVQRTLYVGHLIPDGFHVPIHYCSVAAVILARVGGRFHVLEDFFRMREMVLISEANVPDPSTLEGLIAGGLEVVDVEVAGRNFNELCRAAQRVSKAQRLKLEAELIADWAERTNDGSFLVVDGTIMNLRSERAVSRCLGVSKEMVERYFGLQNHRKIMNLRLGERSWVFNFKTEEQDARMGGRDRLSWYLRIRDIQGRHPEFGLLRCELSRSHSAAASELATRLSASLLRERYPIAFPDTRWDRLLYPIRQCEQYIRSRCRPIPSIQAAFGRTGRI